MYSMSNTLNEEKLKDKFTEDDKKKINEAKEKCQQWLDSNQNAEAEEFEKQLKELEGIFNPIMQRVYQEAGG